MNRDGRKGARKLVEKRKKIVDLSLLCAHCLGYKLDQSNAEGDINDEAFPGVGSNQQPIDQKSSTLPLDYCTACG